MASRFTDPAVASKADFIIRKQKPSILMLALLFSAALAVTFVTSLVIQNFPGIWGFGLLAVIIFILTLYTIYFTQRSHDMVLATEFQNAMFASAAGLNTQFCLITKRDGTIVYFDPNFQKLFPTFTKMDNRAIDTLLDLGQVTGDDKKKIFAAFEKGGFHKVVFPLRIGDGSTIKIILTIDPLPRPSGFLLLRAREYVEQRADQSGALMPSAANTGIQSEIIGTLVNTLPIGLYATSVSGKLQFANRVLCQWLGYEENEMTDRGMELHHLIYQMNDKLLGNIELRDFEGEVLLQKKTGNLLKVHLRQELYRDAAGNLLGSTGTVTQFEDETSDLKKKLNPI